MLGSKLTRHLGFTGIELQLCKVELLGSSHSLCSHCSASQQRTDRRPLGKSCPRLSFPPQGLCPASTITCAIFTRLDQVMASSLGVFLVFVLLINFCHEQEAQRAPPRWWPSMPPPTPSFSWSPAVGTLEPTQGQPCRAAKPCTAAHPPALSLGFHLHCLSCHSPPRIVQC